MSTQTQSPSEPEGPETPTKGRGSKKAASKGGTYQKGHSCIQLGQKHNYKPTPSGKSMRCTKCGSTRWLAGTKKSKKGKKGRAKAESEEQGNDSSDNNGE